MAKEQVMEVGGQRRAFPAGRHVPASKVGHCGDASPLGDDGRRAQLQGGSDRSDDRFAPRLRQVMERLPMCADQRHSSRRHTRRLQDLQRRPGKPFPQRSVQVTHVLHRPTGHGLQEPLAKGGRVRERAERLERDLQTVAGPADVHQRGIHAVGGGARHQAEDIHGTGT